MRQPGPSRARRGFTLIEAVTAVAVLAIVSVGVSMLYTQAITLYARGQRESTSRDKASLALEKVLPEIREAYNVDYPGPHLIVFTLPERGTDGQYLVDPSTKALRNGKQVAVYQADGTGVYGTNGRFIWRSEKPYGAAQWAKTGLVMDDVEDLSFTYAPSTEMLELVQVAITVGQGTYPGYFNRTEVAEVYVRNH
jgi:prepilin-type N-terminal cleavage/methylation domain-containing protein